MLIQTYYLHFNRKTGGTTAADDGQNVFIPNTSQGGGVGGGSGEESGAAITSPNP